MRAATKAHSICYTVSHPQICCLMLTHKTLRVQHNCTYGKMDLPYALLCSAHPDLASDADCNIALVLLL